MTYADTLENLGKLLGKAFEEMRTECHVSQEAVSEKILTQRAISNFERKGELPSWLAISVLIRRLGKNADYFVPVLSRHEYEYLIWKNEMLDKLQSGGITEDDWKSDMARSEYIHPVLQRQFVTFWKGFMYDDIVSMQQAVALTVPGYPQTLSLKSCVGTEELGYLLICMERKLQLFPEKWREEQTMLESVIRYIELRYQREEQVRIYYRAVCLYGEYMQKVDPAQKLAYYNKALKLHRELANLVGLEDVLRGIIRESEGQGISDLREYREYLNALESIRKEYCIENENFVYRHLSQEYYLLHEILSTYRKERGIKVREIDRDVCSEKTYRALERGKRNANKGTYAILAEYMKIPLHIIGSEIVTDKYSDLVLADRIRQAGQREDSEERLRLLDELEISLGEKINIPENRQYINSVRDFELFYNGSITLTEYKHRVEEAIRLTIPNWEVGYRIHFYTRREIILVYYDAIIFRRLHQYDTAIFLMEDMWGRLDNSEMDKRFRMHEVLLVLALWKNLLSDEGRFDEALRMAVEGIKLCFLSGRGDMIDTFVLEIGWSMNNKYPQMMADEKNKCFKYIKYTICFNKLFYQEETRARVEQYCRELIGKEQLDA